MGTTLRETDSFKDPKTLLDHHTNILRAQGLGIPELIDEAIEAHAKAKQERDNKMGSKIKVSKVKKGEFIKKTADSTKVFIRGEFIRDGGWADGKGRYSLQDTEDMNRETFIKGDKIVFVGFTY